MRSKYSYGMNKNESGIPASLTTEEEEFLHALHRVMRVLPPTLDHDLRRLHGVTTNDYLTLLTLSQAPDRTMSMGALARAGAFTLSAVSRIVERLEERGLVYREYSTKDKRSRHAILTVVGHQHLREARSTYLAGVRGQVLDHVDGEFLPDVAQALRQITDGVYQ